MRGSWARVFQGGCVAAGLVVGLGMARVGGQDAQLAALDGDPVATLATPGPDQPSPVERPTATSAPTEPSTTPTSDTPTARPTPPPDPRPVDAVDEDPRVRPTETSSGSAGSSIEPEVAGIATVAPATPVPTADPRPATSAPRPVPTATPTPAPTPTSDTTASAPAPPTATPVPTPVPRTPPPAASLDERGQEALTLIAYPWTTRLPGWSVDFLDDRAGVRGLTFTNEQRIEIYVRPDDSAWEIARVVAHELGHAVDLSLNGTAERHGWLAQRGITSAPWWPGSGAADFDSGAGDFAECFAAWQVGSGSLAIGGACSQTDLDMVAALS